EETRFCYICGGVLSTGLSKLLIAGHAVGIVLDREKNQIYYLDSKGKEFEKEKRVVGTYYSIFPEEKNHTLPMSTFIRTLKQETGWKVFSNKVKFQNQLYSFNEFIGGGINFKDFLKAPIGDYNCVLWNVWMAHKIMVDHVSPSTFGKYLETTPLRVMKSELETVLIGIFPSELQEDGFNRISDGASVIL
ncbi:MAG: hypothetical protein P0S93_03650, partial [Candidatus Neptunochlamydia sp.]|nr:hypothetical protein [Candidatus Neptunochlamydia sp.]